ncbi:transposase [Nocardiopsis composta]|uniref:Transposase n=1 Tax=Nocardiopsis composta TaxID=157465 RepID=A0A7W8QJ66_9ACTN|nr:transposase [Nocardiopsis composta]
MTRAQPSDAEWDFIAPFLPIGAFGPYPHNLRAQFEGVVWKFRSGAQWREMPECFGPWQTAYDRFRHWRKAGVFAALLDGAIAEAARQGEADLSLVSVDSTTARAHHDAAGLPVDAEVLHALERAATEKGAPARDKTDTSIPPPTSAGG